MIKFLKEKMFGGFIRQGGGRAQGVALAAIILALSSVASRFLGLWRDRMLAGSFGAGDALDVYYAAFRLPDLIYNLLIMGALSAGFIPVFVSLWNKSSTPSQTRSRSDNSVEKNQSVSYSLSAVEGLHRNNQEAWKFVNSILNILLVGLLVLGVLFFALAPHFMKAITPGFDGEKLAQTVFLTRLMFLSPLLLGLSAIFGGVLQSLKRFLAFSLAPIFYNLGIIGGLLFLAPRFGILGVVWGVLLGALFHFLIQSLPVFWSGFKYRFIIDLKSEGVWRLAKMIVPRSLALAISQLNFLFITFLASSLAAGSLAIFSLAYNIWTFPLGVFAGSLAMAVFPTLAENAAKKDSAAFAQNFSSNFRQIVFLIFPASVFFAVLAQPVIAVILGTGKFGQADVALAANTLIFLMFGLLAESLILLLARGFFAFDDARTPFWLGFFSSFIRLGGAWYFSLSFGVAGLALGYALGGILYAVLLWLFLWKKVGDLRAGEIFFSFFKVAIASFIAGAVVWLTWQMLDAQNSAKNISVIFEKGFLAGLAGIFIYLLAALIFGLSEIKIIWQKISKR